MINAILNQLTDNFAMQHSDQDIDTQNQPLNLKLNPVSAAAHLATEPTVEENESLFGEVRQTWAEIDEIYKSSATAVVETVKGIKEALDMVRPITTSGDIDNIKELNVLTKGFQNDIERFTDTLTSIQKEHVGKEGLVETSEDLTLCFSLFEKYVNFNTEFRAITFPTVVSIMENVSTIVHRAKEDQANNISDVVEKQSEATEQQQQTV